MFVPEQRAAVRGWLIVALGGAFVIALFIGLVADPIQTLDYLSRKIAVCTLGLVLMTGAALAIDVFTPREWLERIADDPRASSNIMCAAVFGMALIVCFV